MFLYNQMTLPPPIWIALLAAGAFAILAERLKSLTISGAIAAFVIGTVIFGMGGWLFAIPLFTFFLSSSLLSRYKKNEKKIPGLITEKGATRDAWQVLANGGVSAIIVTVFYFTVHRFPWHISRNLLCLYLAALATVNADTWATEIGSLSKNPPRLLKNWKPAERGTSGAISGLGLAASLAGSVIIPLSVYWFWKLDTAEFFVIVWAGFLGSFADSILGASVQAVYKNPKTNSLSEKSESQGTRNVRVSGISWIGNDAVNFLASLFGVLCAWLLLKYSVTPFR